MAVVPAENMLPNAAFCSVGLPFYKDSAGLPFDGDSAGFCSLPIFPKILEPVAVF
jgi:hypothetical protein